MSRASQYDAATPWLGRPGDCHQKSHQKCTVSPLLIRLDHDAKDPDSESSDGDDTFCFLFGKQLLTLSMLSLRSLRP